MDDLEKNYEIVNHNKNFDALEDPQSSPISFSNNEESSRYLGKNLEQIGTPNKEHFQRAYVQPKDRNKEHYQTFRQSMKYVLLWGQCWGLIPVVSPLDQNPSKVRFKKKSFRFCYSTIIWFLQSIVAMFCAYDLFNKNISISGLANLCFYLSASAVTFMSIRMASKWPAVIQEVSSLNLDLNPRIKLKCTVVFIVLMFVCFAEHCLSIISKISNIMDCNPDKDVLEVYFQTSYFFVFDNGVNYSIPKDILMKIITLVCTVHWNYSDAFIICISLYLTCVLEGINEKIRSAKNKNLSSSSWSSLREEYTGATRLVLTFDNAINSIIFVSFATNLFIICLQLFNVLSHGLNVRTKLKTNCPNYPSGPFRGYENSVYFIFSLLTVLLRSLAVALFLADVHYASLAPAPVLYEIPPNAYCEEVQRFIEQVHGDNVALSGLEFFYVTRELILSVAGAIATYELVLLQFQGVSDSDIPNSN